MTLPKKPKTMIRQITKSNISLELCQLTKNQILKIKKKAAENTVQIFSKVFILPQIIVSSSFNL